ncbi:hypothetical protein SDJN02_25291, partial [Cucurbita argyrosperma subsp. argyrosperma]
MEMGSRDTIFAECSFGFRKYILVLSPGISFLSECALLSPSYNHFDVIHRKKQAPWPFSDVSALFSQNFKCKALFSSICSISSIGRPFVSGTHIRTNISATIEINPNIRNVQEGPIDCVKDKKD